MRTQSKMGVLHPSQRLHRWKLHWQFSLPLLIAACVYLFSLYLGGIHQSALLDGDTYMHLAAGQWISENRQIPTGDPFSHTLLGAPWTAHEWLAEVLLAWIHDLTGWTGLVAVTALALAISVALLVRALLRLLPPTWCILLGLMATLMTVQHLLVRPHMLAMPLLIIWTIGLVRASDEGRRPPLWLLPIMAVWANLHGGFTLGLGLAVMLGLEAVFTARNQAQFREIWRGWLLFVGLAFVASLLTPQGLHGLVFTWQLMVEDQYALSRIGEWASPNFHVFQPLAIWLLGGMAIAFHKGLRLPPFRLVLLLGLIYLSLKHVRNIELVGFLGPLLFAAPIAAQWSSPELPRPDVIQRWLLAHTVPATPAAILACSLLFIFAPTLFARTKLVEPPEHVAPRMAIQAARAAGVAEGNVLNGYRVGGWLILERIPVFIDGRSDVYRPILQTYLDALELRPTADLDLLLDQYKIQWTLLDAQTPAISHLDRSPSWRRIYEDEHAVVHARSTRGDSALPLKGD